MIIRDISSVDELHAVEALQKDVWGVADIDVLPAIHMIAARAVGAIIIGAFEGDDLIGFVYGFPGFESGHRVIHSDMLAVLPSHRDRGVGRALKLAQRDAALAQGVDRITWTFDPHQPLNAWFNFVRLGVTADRYLRDFYGTTTSPLHRHGTDRLWVTWHLNEERRVSPAGKRVRIPASREELRREFESAFAEGYIVTGFERNEGSCAYLLSR